MRGLQVYLEVIEGERPHLEQLEELAKAVCCDLYGIESELLDAKLTQTPRFGTIRYPDSDAGREILKGMIGWSAVVRQQEQLSVKATATFWPMLVHELIKGSVELICLHGMNNVSEADFAVALERTDHIEFEIPMLQIGGTIFKQFLLARPEKSNWPRVLCTFQCLSRWCLSSLCSDCLSRQIRRRVCFVRPRRVGSRRRLQAERTVFEIEDP